MEQLETEAAKYKIVVEEGAGEVVLVAPDGMQFDDDLHSLVNSTWDRDPWPNVVRSAINDVKEYGPRLQPCPTGCECGCA